MNNIELKSFLEDLACQIARKIGQIDAEESIKKKFTVINTDTQTYMFADWLNKWFNTYKINNANSTKHQQKVLIKNIAKSSLGNVYLNQLKVLDIQDFLLTITARRQREHYYVMIKDSLNKAFIAGVIDKDISKQILLKKSTPTETKVFTTEEEILFEKECLAEQKYFLLTLLYTGMRPIETTRIKHDNVDWEKKTLFIPTSKTINGIRVLPLTDKALNILAIICADKSKDDLIFSKTDFSNYNGEFKKICNKLNLKGFIPYSLRHTFATRCVEKGVAAPVLQKWLGHSDIKITLKHYVKVVDEFEKINLEKIN